MIQYAIYTGYGGALLYDFSGRATQASFATNNRGMAECRAFVPMDLPEAFQLYDRAGLPHVHIVDDGAGIAFEGRLEDVAITGAGVTLTAFGYARALSDAPYTALWSTTQVSAFRPFLTSEVSTAFPERFHFDTNNRLFIAPTKGAIFGNTTVFKTGLLGYITPSQGTRDIVGAQFEYEYVLPAAGWRVAFQTRNASFTGIANPWLFQAPGATATVRGSIFVTFAAAAIVNFFMDFNAADAVYAGETGAAYLKITNVRLVTSTANMVNTTHTVARGAGVNVTATVGSTARMYVGQQLGIGATGVTIGETVIVKQVLNSTQFVADFTAAAAIGLPVQAHIIYADEIVEDIVGDMNALNSTQLSSSLALIESPAVDLLDEVYEDRMPDTILDYLAGLGDNQTTPRQWEWGVALGQQLYFRPQGSASRTWYIDIADINIERTLEQLSNSVYAVYQDASGRPLRTAAQSSAISVARYGVTRRDALDVQSTSSTQAGIQASAALADGKDPKPRSGVTINTTVYDAQGNRWPLWVVRAGDIVVIRNLPPTLSTSIDRIRTMRLSRTSYVVTSDTLSLEPESPLPQLDALLARLAAGLGEQ